jgi:hypothetical protein
MAGTRTRWALGPVAMALAALLAGCGVTLQDAAEPLPSNALPAPLRIPTPAPPPSPSTGPTAQPSASPAPTASRLRVWFVQDDGLAAVESSLPVGSVPDVVLQSLAIGPTPAEAEQGLRTVARDPLTGQALVFVSPTQPSPSAADPAATTSAATGPPQVIPSETAASVTVILSPAFGALPPSEQVLLLGQVVLSLAGAGERSIAFVDDSGSPVAVPLPDGRLLDTPATARDYASLIVRP